MAEYEAVVVGAGLAGATVAQQLYEAGKKVLVVDKRDHIAGTAYDELNEHGIRVARYGPHIFYANDDRIVDYLSRFTDWRPYEHRVVAETSRGYLPVPINRTTLERFYGLDLQTEENAKTLLDSVREDTPNPKNVEEAVVREVGWDLYRELFEPYTEKQWGRHPRELDPCVVGRFAARTNRDDRYFTSKFQAMPKDGYTAMVGRMLEGIEVQLGVDACGWDLAAPEVPTEQIVWTGPVDEAFDCCYGPLPWRSLHFEHQTCRSRGLEQPTGVVNYPSGRFTYTRRTEWRHLTGQQSDLTTLSYEYPRAEGDPYYPVPSPEARELRMRYADLAKRERNVTFVGRLARYQYLSMHQVIGQALKAARDLLGRWP